MSDPQRAVVRVQVPKVSNVIEIGEILRALRDVAAREATQAPGRAALSTDRSGDLGRVQDLAGELADLIDRIPDFPRRPPPS
ncbi:hypothetical protein [Geodermatophilus sp. URMC 64]